MGELIRKGFMVLCFVTTIAAALYGTYGGNQTVAIGVMATTMLLYCLADAVEEGEDEDEEYLYNH